NRSAGPRGCHRSAGGGRCQWADYRRLAHLTGHGDHPPDGDFRSACEHARRLALWPGAAVGALGIVAGTPAMVALCLRARVAGCAWLRLAGRFRGAGPASLPDGCTGAALAPAFSSSRRLVAVAGGL